MENHFVRIQSGAPVQNMNALIFQMIFSIHIGKEKVHFEASAPAKVPEEMSHFLARFNSANKIDPVKSRYCSSVACGNPSF